MGHFSKWLLQDEQKELFDYLFANVLNVVFLALTALVLWPMGHAAMAWRLTKGYWLFWIVMILTAIIVFLFQRLFRVDMYSHFDVYVISGLAVSGFLQAGWSAFAALVLRTEVEAAPLWVNVILYSIGVFSCYVACVIVSAFYMGGIYRLVNLPLALLSFIVFQPVAGRRPRDIRLVLRSVLRYKSGPFVAEHPTSSISRNVFAVLNIY